MVQHFHETARAWDCARCRWQDARGTPDDAAHSTDGIHRDRTGAWVLVAIERKGRALALRKILTELPSARVAHRVGFQDRHLLDLDRPPANVRDGHERLHPRHAHDSVIRRYGLESTSARSRLRSGMPRWRAQRPLGWRGEQLPDADSQGDQSADGQRDLNQHERTAPYEGPAVVSVADRAC